MGLRAGQKKKYHAIFFFFFCPFVGARTRTQMVPDKKKKKKKWTGWPQRNGQPFHLHATDFSRSGPFFFFVLSNSPTLSIAAVGMAIRDERTRTRIHSRTRTRTHDGGLCKQPNTSIRFMTM